MSAEALTNRQAEILKFLRGFLERMGGIPPTRAEICKFMGFRSPNAAEDALRRLERKGYVEMVPSISRGIRLTVLGQKVELK